MTGKITRKILDDAKTHKDLHGTHGLLASICADISKHRAKILEEFALAYCAETGLMPSEIELVEQAGIGLDTKWFFRKLDVVKRGWATPATTMAEMIRLAKQVRGDFDRSQACPLPHMRRLVDFIIGMESDADRLDSIIPDPALLLAKTQDELFADVLGALQQIRQEQRELRQMLDGATTPLAVVYPSTWATDEEREQTCRAIEGSAKRPPILSPRDLSEKQPVSLPADVCGLEITRGQGSVISELATECVYSDDGKTHIYDKVTIRLCGDVTVKYLKRNPHLCPSCEKPSAHGAICADCWQGGAEIKPLELLDKPAKPMLVIAVLMKGQHEEEPLVVCLIDASESVEIGDPLFCVDVGNCIVTSKAPGFRIGVAASQPCKQWPPKIEWPSETITGSFRETLAKVSDQILKDAVAGYPAGNDEVLPLPPLAATFTCARCQLQTHGEPVPITGDLRTYCPACAREVEIKTVQPDELCTCKPSCPKPCKGGCGCSACADAYSDFLSNDYE